ncbi:DUF6036 family nucleotidyltransferase [Staphylococcus pseudoxylosus]|uniref:DUF6036 family nucleotidyltransferase n=1 Tax=Staphylococcus pseudoxylosus TaxID=2282419 RepID=UPI00398A9B09
MSSYTISEAKQQLDDISPDLPLIDRMLKVAVIITKLTEDKKIHNNSIIVGGLSMEIHSHSFYTTQDIDFVTSASIKLKTILKQLGFNDDNRVFIYEKLDVAVDIPDNALEFSESYDRLVKYYINETDYVYVVSVEDIILDRLEDYDYADTENYTKYAITINYIDLDVNYIRKEIGKRDKDALNIFNKWLDEIEQQIK